MEKLGIVDVDLANGKVRLRAENGDIVDVPLANFPASEQKIIVEKAVPEMAATRYRQGTAELNEGKL